MPGPNGRDGRGGGRGGRGRGRPSGRGGTPPGPTPTPSPPAPTAGAPPAPPHELAPDPVERRSFDVEGEAWTAWVAGKGAWGSGGYGLGMVVAVQFARGTAPDRPVCEALLPRGRFAFLFDDELRALLADATPIAAPPPAGPRPDARRPRRSRDW